MFKLMRRGSARVVAISVIFLTVLACIYYTSYTNSVEPTPSSESKGDEGLSLKLMRVKPQGASLREALLRPANLREWVEQDSSVNSNVCPLMWSAQADVDTVSTFKTFDFQVRYFLLFTKYWNILF